MCMYKVVDMGIAYDSILKSENLISGLCDAYSKDDDENDFYDVGHFTWNTETDQIEFSFEDGFDCDEEELIDMKDLLLENLKCAVTTGNI